MTIALIIVGIIILLGLIGLGVWWALRKQKIKNGFEGPYGIEVYLSAKTAYLTPEMVKQWTDDLVNHWHTKKGWPLEEIRASIAGSKIQMLDQEYIEYEGDNDPSTTEYANGLNYLQSKTIYITTLREGQTEAHKQRVWSLWRHELSHLPVAIIGGLWTNKESHAMFKETGLGA